MNESTQAALLTAVAVACVVGALIIAARMVRQLRALYADLPHEHERRTRSV